MPEPSRHTPGRSTASGPEAVCWYAVDPPRRRHGPGRQSSQNSRTAHRVATRRIRRAEIGSRLSPGQTWVRCGRHDAKYHPAAADKLGAQTFCPRAAHSLPAPNPGSSPRSFAHGVPGHTVCSPDPSANARWKRPMTAGRRGSSRSACECASSTSRSPPVQPPTNPADRGATGPRPASRNPPVSTRCPAP